MRQERLLQVLLGPHVSEKTTNVADKSNQTVFKVLKGATKAEIKDAVEMLFDVKVKAIQVLNVKGKQKRSGRRSDWKKAYVSLQEGQEINFREA